MRDSAGALFVYSVLPKGLKLYCNGSDVLHFLHMPHSNSIISLEFHASYGTHLLKNIGRIRLLWKEQNVAD